ncbi:translocation/assembly module TamB domain-containing protein [Jonquetella anthropi]|uniref:hypothetical protein n=1 Tax=Jonquetella anthropi TaxID=428712 RepID=UPI0001B910A6|nr:hypothetical protein [Jonquetella anthropi]EEX48147.1 hypothetical protein GCWU000246_01466 [Jonquetella anthropi E3_33 E1]
MRKIYRRSLAGLCTVLIILVAACAVLLFVGDWGARLASRYGKQYLAGVPLDVTFDDLRGNLGSGYDLTGLSLRTQSGSDVLELKDLRFGLSRLSLSPLGGSLDLRSSGLRLTAGNLSEFFKDVDAAFPSEPEKQQEPFHSPLQLGTVLIEDWQGTDLPWAVERLSVAPGEKFSQLEASLSWQGVPIHLSGLVSPDLNDPAGNVTVQALDASITLSGRLSEGFDVTLSGLKLDKLKELERSLEPLQLGGSLSGSVRLVPTKNGWAISGRLSGQDLAALGSLIGSFVLPFKYDGSMASVDGASGTVFGGALAADGTFDAGDPNFPLFLQVKLTGARLDKAPGVKGTGAGVGLGAVDVQLAGPLKELSGKASFSDARLSWQGLTAQKLKGQAAFDLGNADFSLSGQVLGGSLNASGTVGETVKAKASLKGANLSGLSVLLPGVSPKGKVTASASAEGPRQNPNFSLSLQASGLGGKGVTVDSLSAEALGSMEEIKLSSLKAGLFGGSLKASGAFRLASGGLWGDLEASAGGFTAKGLKKGWPASPVSSLGKNSASASVHLQGPKRSAAAKVSAASAVVSGTALKDAVFSADWDGKRLMVNKAGVKLLGGQTDLSGDVTLEADPALNLFGTASKLDLRALGMPLSGFVNGKVKLGGTVSKPQLDAQVNLPQLAVGRLVLQNCVLAASGFGKYSVRLSADGPDGNLLKGEGTFSLPADGAGGTVDLTAELSRFDLSSVVPPMTPLSGLISGQLTAKGSLLQPSVTARVWSDKIQSGAITVLKPEAQAVMTQLDKIDVTMAAGLGDRRPEAKALVTLKNGIKAEFHSSAQGIPLSALVPDAKDVLAGRLSWKVKGKFTPKAGVQADGLVSSDRLGTRWIALDDLSLPMTVRSSVLKIPAGTASLVGAPVTIQATGDLKSQNLKAALDASNIQVDRLVAPFKVPGKFSGAMELHAKADFQMGGLLSGALTGEVIGKDVFINDVPYMKLVTSGSPVKIKKALITFRATPDEVFILPGSTMSAWADDPVFSYVAFSGPVWRQSLESVPGVPKDLLAGSRDTVKLAVNGNFNVKALNSLLGGIGVLIQGGMEGADPKELASGFVQGLIGNAKNQFRDVSFTVAGPYDDLRVDDLKIENEISFARKNDWAYGAGHIGDESKKQETSYSLKFKIPIGPGEGKGSSVGEQATNQILKQIVDSLIQGAEE